MWFDDLLRIKYTILLPQHSRLQEDYIKQALAIGDNDGIHSENHQ